VLAQQVLDQGAIADITVDKNMPRIAFDGSQISKVAGVGELIQVDDWLLVRPKPIKNEIAADETGSSGD
jgi:hypothetical protein